MASRRRHSTHAIKRRATRPARPTRAPILLAGLLLGVSPWAARPSVAEETLDLGRFEPTFSAEFDDPADVTTKFIHHFRRWGNLRTLSGNAERQIYVDKDFLAKEGAGSLPSPFAVENGILRITARRTPSAYRDRIGFAYTSGMVTTEESFSQEYGYFEIRCRMPGGQGLWPAFWLVGLTHEEPLEIDVVEILEHRPRTSYHTIHAPKRMPKWGIEIEGPDSTAGFHTYGVDWKADGIDFYIDRKRVGQAPIRLPGPMYMIANLAVGGEWPGDPDATTSFPAVMQVDYIRAYKPK